MSTGLVLAGWLCRGVAAETAAEQVEFFEKKVRPIFADSCYSCHSDQAGKAKGGLKLDTPTAILKGGGTGAALTPGDPEMSLLIKAVRYTDPDLQMPPKDKKLSAEQIADLEAWVKLGAPMPRGTNAGALTDVTEAKARHWAFQPVTQPKLPRVKRSTWVQTPVDDFVLAKLEQKNLPPAPAADRRTLIRRVTYDLTGLPPTPEEVEAFVNDKSPAAYAMLVDRLLASPHYGERWGRYWLDVARYADTKGYLAGGQERRYSFSYTYRDYVVRAFNEDKPYDQFLMEQIAADVLPKPAGASNEVGSVGRNQQALAALGFLTLGRRFLNNQNDIIDDRIDVVSRGTMGLTVTCARCHDHKFEPISTKDYYALHGVFAGSDEPAELPLLAPLHDTPDYQAFLVEKGKIEEEITAFTKKHVADFEEKLRHKVGDYLLGARGAAALKDDAKLDTYAGEQKLNPAVLKRWIKYLDDQEKKPDAVFGAWFELAKIPAADFTTNTVGTLTNLSAVNPKIKKTLATDAPGSLKGVAESYNKVFKSVDADWKAAVEAAAKDKKPAVTNFADADQEALRLVLYGEGAPVNLPVAEAETILSRGISEGTAPIRNKIDALNWTHAGAPLRAMVLEDRANPGNSRVLIRGNPSNPGAEVPRRFLEVLSVAAAAPFTNGSGRLELARAIASPANPLTARVYVNRVWLHHFGEGLVTTPGDFGVRTEAPVQRELLDYLAASFMANGWSTKALHRMIVLSAAYQQSCEASPATRKADPENRLISRMNRQRLDFEAMRDTFLALAGQIDLRVGGLPVDIVTEPFSQRRTLYGLIDRQNLPGLFRTFDFANPDTSNQGRFHTIVPQQALFLMNSPFILQEAHNLAERSAVKSAATPEQKIQALYELVYQRPPAKQEVKDGTNFLNAPVLPNQKVSPLELYAQILLLANETIFVD